MQNSNFVEGFTFEAWCKYERIFLYAENTRKTTKLLRMAIFHRFDLWRITEWAGWQTKMFILVFLHIP